MILYCAFVDFELYFNQTILLVDAVYQLWNVDVAERSSEQTECDCIKKGKRLSVPVRPTNQSRGTLLKVNLREVIAKGSEILEPDFLEVNHL